MPNIQCKASALSSRNRVDSKCKRIYIFGRNNVESLPDSSRGTLVSDPSGRLLKSKAPKIPGSSVLARCGICFKIPNTSCLPKMLRQTLQTQIRLLLKKQSDQDLPCLLFWQDFVKSNKLDLSKGSIARLLYVFL